MRIIAICILSLFGFLVAAPAQTDLTQAVKSLKFRNVGPAGMSGRITAIAVHPDFPEVIYAGTASGGIWKSEGAGVAWKPIFEDQPTQSIGALAIAPGNANIIWAGTGEGNPRNSQNSGLGIFKSLDGGRSWQHMGLENSKTIHRIIIHPQNPDIIYVGAQGSAWGPNEDRGVFKTTDGGKSWKKILYVNDQTGVGEMVMAPGHPDRLLVNMWQFERKPWEFKSGGPGTGLYMTNDGGANWKKLSAKDGLPEGELGRMGLAYASNKPNIVYAIIEAEKNGLYKSTDGGFTWSLVSEKNIGDRPFYYAEIYVDPINENRIWNLYTLVSKSEDGGKTFQVILPYGGENGVHPDHHAFWIDPLKGQYLIEGNDGGLNISYDGGATWKFCGNLPVGQFYHINVDQSIPYRIGGGLQDNGSWIGPSAVWRYGGIRNSDWKEIYFGDGFDVLFHPKDKRYAYAMSQGGNVSYLDLESGWQRTIKPVHPTGKKLRFNWNTAIAHVPQNDCGLYLGSQFVHRSLDCGKSWEIISPDLTTNDSLKISASQKSGGLTPDVTSAENHCTILTIAPSVLDSKTIWVGTDDGNIQLTRDGGASWKNVTTAIPGLPNGAWIPSIVNGNKAGEAFVVANNYRKNDWKPYLFHTNDYGSTWKQLATDPTLKGHVLSVCQDPVVPDLLFCGTDQGLYWSIDFGKHWLKFLQFPSVNVTDLIVHTRDHDLIIGTFGRAIWILDDIKALREIALSKGAVLHAPAVVFEANPSWQVNYLSYDGMRFPGDGDFIGENKPGGAAFTIWINPIDSSSIQKPEVSTKNSEKEKRAKGKQVNTASEPTKASPKASDNKTPKKDKKKKEPTPFIVFSNAGDTLYRFKVPLDTGFNRVYWNYQRKGVKFPSRNESKIEDNDPYGGIVMPGTYKVKMYFGKLVDSTFIEVKPDPRIGFSDAVWKERAAGLNDLENLIKSAATLTYQLREAKKTIERVETSTQLAPDSLKKNLSTLAAPLKDSIENLFLLFVNPEETKGIQRSSDHINSLLFTARDYLEDSWGPPSQMAVWSKEKAKKAIQHAATRIGQFFDGPWKQYQLTVEKNSTPLFKSFEPIKTD